MSDYVPVYLPGHELTYSAGAIITGGQVLVLSGDNTVIPSAGASNRVVGVACHDAANGSRVTVSRGGTQTLTASAAITWGTPLKSAAAGQVAAFVDGTDAPGLLIGLANTSAAGANSTLDATWKA